ANLPPVPTPDEKDGEAFPLTTGPEMALSDQGRLPVPGYWGQKNLRGQPHGFGVKIDENTLCVQEGEWER
ncbi:unnamed protein product, partial [Heterosigma akashiwo]